MATGYYSYTLNNPVKYNGMNSTGVSGTNIYWTGYLNTINSLGPTGTFTSNVSVNGNVYLSGNFISSLPAIYTSVTSTNGVTGSNASYPTLKSTIVSAGIVNASTTNAYTSATTFPLDYSLFGTNWTQNTNVSALAFNDIAMSLNGQYQTATVNGGNIYTNTNYGNGLWTLQASSLAWKWVAVSATGQYQVAVVNTGGVYTNTTYGAGTWTLQTQNTIPTSTAWQSVAMSGSGQYITAVGTSSTLWVSNNATTTRTWTRVTFANTSLAFSGVAMSSSGAYQTAVIGTGVCTNSNYGITPWTITTLSVTSNSFTSVAMSSSGQYQTIAGVNSLYTNSNYGVGSWTYNTNSGSFSISGVVVSSTGQYQVIVIANNLVYINSNYGVGAFTTSSLGSVLSIAMSSTGQYLTCCQNAIGIFTSTTPCQTTVTSTINVTGTTNTSVITYPDGTTSTSAAAALDYSTFGTTWVQNSPSPSNVLGLAISSSGQYQTAVCGNNGAGVSFNSSYGVGTWTISTSTPTNLYWYSVAMSSSGQYQTAVVNGGGIYYNSNYGLGTWILSTSAPNSNSTYWNSVAVSSTGQYQTAVLTTPGALYYNSSYGSGIWTPFTPTLDLLGVAMSSSGQYQTAVGIYAIYYNSNYGIGTWTPSTSASIFTQWKSIAMSSSGQYQISAPTGGSVYTSTTSYPTFFCDGLVVNGAVKSFIIDHPIDLSRYLVHACVEGPEIGVYYRGEATVTDDESVDITLPDYVKYIAYDYTVQITPTTPTVYSTSEVDNGTGVFTVYGKNGSFYWSVYGTRGTISVDPRRDAIRVKGDGPYKYIV